MAFKRLEVHLRSNFPTEAGLRDEMSHIEDVYGGKTDFIKQRVLLGYALLKERLVGVDVQDSLAIARVAQSLSQGHDPGSRLERAVMTFARILQSPPAASAPEPVAAPRGAAAKVAEDVVAAALNIVSARPSRPAAAVVVAPAPESAPELPAEPVVATIAEGEAAETGEDEAPRTANRWQHLKGLTRGGD